ncbi:N4-gp56 family major capsid protein [bacterium]|nr:N4-gp56 family major capsid protein [bacterium]NDC93978.1 N4-gp56 family major capsid protein [bacterium]NDD83283.1 N4-gp56 family major capsid protein [bacterium]
MATSTTLTNAANLHLYYEKKLLSTLEPRLVLMPLGKKQRLPKGNGKQVKWLRYSAIAGSTSPLSEGTPPAEISFSTSNVTADVVQYGQFAKVSDLLSDTAIDPVLENLSERFGIAASKTIEELIVSELANNCANQNVNNRANFAAIQAGDLISHKELIEAMIRQKADFIGPHESGQYVVVLHPRAEYDLMVDSQAGSWLDIQKGVDNKPLLNGEVARMYGMKFLVSDKMLTSVGTGSGSIDVVQSFVIGEEAFGVVELNGDSMKMFIKRHGSAGANDPLDQFATVGYKIHGFAAKYLDAGSKRVIAINSATGL